MSTDNFGNGALSSAARNQRAARQTRDYGITEWAKKNPGEASLVVGVGLLEAIKAPSLPQAGNELFHTAASTAAKEVT